VGDVRLDARTDVSRALGLSPDEAALQSDEQIFALALAKWGTDAPARLNGGFGVIAWDRWAEIAMQITPDNTRLLVYKSIWTEALPVSGWWGFGAGTFQITFPFFCHHVGDEIKGIWRYAHEDYLQTILEWGWVGASLWAVLIFGGLARGANLRAPATSLPTEVLSAALLENAAFLSLTGICLHALIDCPFQIASLALYATVCLALLWTRNRLPASPPVSP
jgi:O-antigen ligase